MELLHGCATFLVCPPPPPPPGHGDTDPAPLLNTHCLDTIPETSLDEALEALGLPEGGGGSGREVPPSVLAWEGAGQEGAGQLMRELEWLSETQRGNVVAAPSPRQDDGEDPSRVLHPLPSSPSPSHPPPPPPSHPPPPAAPH